MPSCFPSSAVHSEKVEQDELGINEKSPLVRRRGNNGDQVVVVGSSSFRCMSSWFTLLTWPSRWRLEGEIAKVIVEEKSKEEEQNGQYS